MLLLIMLEIEKYLLNYSTLKKNGKKEYHWIVKIDIQVDELRLDIKRTIMNIQFKVKAE